MYVFFSETKRTPPKKIKKKKYPGTRARAPVPWCSGPGFPSKEEEEDDEPVPGVLVDYTVFFKITRSYFIMNQESEN
jgi:hypothetical protein